MTDVRWKQRLQNFDRALVLLRSGLESKALDAFTDLEREGLIPAERYFPALDALHEWLARSVQP